VEKELIDNFAEWKEDCLESHTERRETINANLEQAKINFDHVTTAIKNEEEVSMSPLVAIELARLMDGVLRPWLTDSQTKTIIERHNNSLYVARCSSELDSHEVIIRYNQKDHDIRVLISPRSWKLVYEGRTVEEINLPGFDIVLNHQGISNSLSRIEMPNYESKVVNDLQRILIVIRENIKKVWKRVRGANATTKARQLTKAFSEIKLEELALNRNPERILETCRRIKPSPAIVTDRFLKNSNSEITGGETMMELEGFDLEKEVFLVDTTLRASLPTKTVKRTVLVGRPDPDRHRIVYQLPKNNFLARSKVLDNHMKTSRNLISIIAVTIALEAAEDSCERKCIIRKNCQGSSSKILDTLEYN